MMKSVAVVTHDNGQATSDSIRLLADIGKQAQSMSEYYRATAYTMSLLML